MPWWKWHTHDHHDDDELDFPTEEGAMTLGAGLGLRVLWNKADIVLETPKPTSQPSQPLLSPPGGPSDDNDDNGGDGNANADGPDSTPPRSPRPDTSNPQGGEGGTPVNDKTPVPMKLTEEEGDKPAHLTKEQWAAFNIAEDFKYSTVFERYIW
jgi:hypothetical protein